MKPAVALQTMPPLVLPCQERKCHSRFPSACAEKLCSLFVVTVAVRLATPQVLPLRLRGREHGLLARANNDDVQSLWIEVTQRRVTDHCLVDTSKELGQPLQIV